MKILFQGDSITDAGRNKENIINVGYGYALLIKGELAFSEPEKYEFINKGINGNRVVDIYARIRQDIINLAPDVLSILVGVNDVWHDFRVSPNGVDAEKYFKVYDMLIEEVKTALPDTKIIILEPFVLKVEGTETEQYWDRFDPGVKDRAKMARKIAEKHNLPFVPLQEGFDALCKTAPASYWLVDGVHPTTAGHAFIKNEWLKVFRTL